MMRLKLWVWTFGINILGVILTDKYTLVQPLRTTMVEAAPMAMKNASADMSEESLADDATPRANFAETAFFSALLVTDEAGAIDLCFTLPDTQTKYITRLYAFTPDFEEEVMDEATLEVYSPLSIELSTPRFLTWGDRLEGGL